ncbi:hypothetical protein ScPMuIL_012408 [Solemya velum]
MPPLLKLTPVPEELRRLDNLERQLVALRIPFMKFLSLPQGGQRGVKSQNVNAKSSLIPLANFSMMHQEKIKHPKAFSRKVGYAVPSTHLRVTTLSDAKKEARAGNADAAIAMERITKNLFDFNEINFSEVKAELEAWKMPEYYCFIVIMLRRTVYKDISKSSQRLIRPATVTPMSLDLNLFNLSLRMSAPNAKYLDFGGFDKTLQDFEREIELMKRFHEGRGTNILRYGMKVYRSLFEMVISVTEVGVLSQYILCCLSIRFAKGQDEGEKAMQGFKQYLETRGSTLSQTTEFLPFYALPFVPRHLLKDLEVRLEKFLTLALKSTHSLSCLNSIKESEKIGMMNTSRSINSSSS